MIHGLSESELHLLSELVLNPLHQSGCKVWIFGSRARNTQHPFSDIDLLYALPDGKSLPDGFIGRIKESVEESRLNYKVDLVDINHLAESYKPSVFKDRKQL